MAYNTNARLTFETPLTIAGLCQVRDEIDALLANLSDSDANQADDDRVPEEFAIAEKVAELRRRMGHATWLFLYNCADQLPAGESFTFQDISAALGQPVGTVKSWHRSAAKAINPVQREFGGPPVFEDRWDGTRQHYKMTPEIRKAILELGEGW